MMSIMLFTIILFVVLLLIGTPLFFSVGFSSVLYFLLSDNMFLMSTIPERFVNGMNLFIILAIPLFVFMGEIMGRGGITNDLVDFCNLFVGRLRGGLAYTNIYVSTIFSGISGSAFADVGALGSTLVPAMVKSGYDLEFSSAVTVASSIQAPLIPPSIPALLVAGVAGLSVGAVFLAGAIPGILMAIICTFITWLLAKSRRYPVYGEKLGRKEVMLVIGRASLALLMPIIILGGALGGIFTVTESAAIAVAYSLCIVTFIKKMKIGEMLEILKSTVETTAKAYILLGIVAVFAWIIANEQIPQKIAMILGNFSDNQYALLILLNIFLIFWGMWMDVGAAIIIFSPLIFPIFIEFGVHPIHLATILIFNLMIGLMSPPFGTLLFMCSAVTGVKLGKLIKELLPFYVGAIVLLLLITFVPAISLFLPRLAGFIY